MNESPNVVGDTLTSVNHDLPPHRRKYMTFGPYIIGSTLGEGEFGKVKLGWTKVSSANEIPNQVAIKLIRRDNIKDNPDKEMKIYREINALKHLKHPNIIKLEEILQNSKYIGIVLEYASGGEFYRYIQRKRRLKEVNASKLFAQLISGVNYMHYKGLVHRDLKLENLLLDKNENLMITDFGFVNEFSPQHQLMKTSCGSPCYAAPELVVSTQPYDGAKADTWSCGVILFAMLAGYLPWDDDPTNPNGDDISRLYQYITTTPLKFPDYINPLARDLLRKILVSDPRRRYTISKIQVHEWLSPYYDFLNISPYDWDVAAKLGSTALISLKSSISQNRKKNVRPRSMVLNAANTSSSFNSTTLEQSRTSQFSASMNKLNILREDESEATIKSAYSENNHTTSSKSTYVNHKSSTNDIRTSNLPRTATHSKPRPTTLHITVNPSLQPITVDPTPASLNNENGGQIARYNRTYSKKSLNQHEPKTKAIINTTIDENKILPNTTILPPTKEPPEIIVKKNNETYYDHYGKGTTVQQMQMISTNPNRQKKSDVSNASTGFLTVSKQSPYVKSESVSSHKASSESIANTERKRFSFLSIYSSYSSTKSSLHTSEPSKPTSRQMSSMSSKVNPYEPYISNNESQSRVTDSQPSGSRSRNSTLYTTAPSSIRTIHNKTTHNKMPSSVGINNNINNNTNGRTFPDKNEKKHTKGHNSRTTHRSSVMVSSLSGEKNKMDKHGRKEVSTARKVIDFFKRKSTLL